MAAITSTTPETEAALVSVEESINHFVDGSEKPACDYVEGELFPKPGGTKQHSITQQNIQYDIRRKYGDAFDPLPELTARLRGISQGGASATAGWEYTPDDSEPRRMTDALTAVPITLQLDEVFERVSALRTLKQLQARSTHKQNSR
jgi:hypothetical protein